MAWISKYIRYKVWDEINYPFLNFNCVIVEVLEWISYFTPTLYWACNYLSILGLKLNHVSKRGHWCLFTERQKLTHWGRVTHICVGKLTIIGSDNGWSPGRRQAIIWTNAGLLSIGPLRTYFSENLIKIQQFSLKKMHVKVSSAKCCPSCLGLNVLTFLGTAKSWPKEIMMSINNCKIH